MKKYSLIYRQVIAIIFLFFIGSMVLLNIISPKRTFSESENRNLEQMPKFSFKELIDGKFTSNYEKYIADQFAFRDFFIGVKSTIEKSINKKESNGVYLCKDGYLIQSFNAPKDKEFQDRIEAINNFAISNPNVNKYLMLVPNSSKILEDKLPKYAPIDDETVYMDKVKNSIDKNVKYVDIYDALYSKRNEYIFYKLDHHWTTKGAFYAYEALGKYMGFTPKEDNYFNKSIVTEEFYGSLYSKGGFRGMKSDNIELYTSKEKQEYKVEYFEENKTLDSIYDMSALNKKDKYTIFLGGNHPLLKITSKTSEGKKLLIIKDSYANSFVPFLTEHYSEIYMVDPRYYSEDINEVIKSNKINDVLILYNVNTFFEDASIKNIVS